MKKPWVWAITEIVDEYEKPSELPVLLAAPIREMVNNNDAMSITEEDYLNIGTKKLEVETEKWVKLVREKKVTMSDVPKYLLLEVRARI